MAKIVIMLFYFPTEPDNDIVELPEQEAVHISRVLRLKAGDPIRITNGKGLLCDCRLTEVGKKVVNARIERKYENYLKRNYQLHIAMAPPKNIDRFEWFLEKATEIGIDRITPVICERSERRTIRSERLERVILAAMKQSQKAYKPVLSPIIPFNDLLQEPFAGKGFIAHCIPGNKTDLHAALPGNKDLTLLIGPEGDFSPAEVEAATGRNYQPVSLGDSRLRTETAGVLVCAAAVLLLGK